MVTGLYTVYGGLTAVAWTSSLQCILLLGGGIYVFFAGMAQDRLGLPAVLGTGQRAHLMTPADHPEVPWTALVDPGPVDQRLVLRHQPVHQPAVPGRAERVARQDGRAAGRRAAGAHAPGHLLSRA